MSDITLKNYMWIDENGRETKTKINIKYLEG